MINVDSRFLNLVDGDSMWLTLHILNMANPTTMSCFPSNKTLCRLTGWNIKKLQRVKDLLIEKKVLVVSSRSKDGIQSSNLYTIDSELLGLFVPAKQVNFSDTPSRDKQVNPVGDIPSPPKADNEVLPIEVLVNTDESKDSSSQKALFDFPVSEVKGKKEKKVAGKKKESVADECYHDFIEVWAKEYPRLMADFKPVDGRMINELIRMTRIHVQFSKMVATRELVNSSFEYLIQYVKRERHFCDGKPLTTWVSQYSSIIQEKENGKQKQSPRTRTTTDALNDLIKTGKFNQGHG